MAESGLKCFSRVKTAQNNKKEGAIERTKKHENVKLKEDVPGRFYFEKNYNNANPCAIGVQLQISVPKQTYIFSLDTSRLWYSIECQTRGIPEVICAQRHTTTCMPRHNTRRLLTLSPQTIP